MRKKEFGALEVRHYWGGLTRVSILKRIQKNLLDCKVEAAAKDKYSGLDRGSRGVEDRHTRRSQNEQVRRSISGTIDKTSAV